jgi:hypothetical protein
MNLLLVWLGSHLDAMIHDLSITIKEGFESFLWREREMMNFLVLLSPKPFGLE